MISSRKTESQDAQSIDYERFEAAKNQAAQRMRERESGVNYFAHVDSDESEDECDFG